MADNKPSGWFSKKHQTNTAHIEAGVRYGTRRERQAGRQEDAADRLIGSGDMTTAQRVKVLDDRLGVGVGAKRERARLAKAVK